MSVTRLLISGLLMATGLTLAAFTLHGAFDARQVETAGPSLKPWSTSTFGAGGRLVAASADGREPGPASGPPKLGAKPRAGKAPAVAAEAASADARTARKKPRADKRPTEPAQKAKPQQAAAEWPWSVFGN